MASVGNSALSGIEPFLKGDSGRNTRGLLRVIILCTIAAAAVASRLFSVISEFHPLGVPLDIAMQILWVNW
jgi:hypothetical protein